jgi:hypothetical protein
LVWGILPRITGPCQSPYEYGGSHPGHARGPGGVREAQLCARPLRAHGMEGTAGVLPGSVQCPMDMIDSCTKLQDLDLPVSEEVCSLCISAPKRHVTELAGVQPGVEAQ